MSKFWVEGEMNNDTMGQTIKLFRGKVKMTQEDFAEHIGCTNMILKSSENGKGAHIYGTLVKMCNKFNLKSSMSIEESENKLFKS